MSNATDNHKTKISQSRNLIIFIIVVFILLFLFIWMLSSSNHESNKVEEKINFSDPLKNANPESIVLEKVQKGVEETKKQTEELKKQLNDEIASKGGSTDVKQKELEDRLTLLEKKLETNQTEGKTLSSATGASDAQYLGRVTSTANSGQEMAGNQVIDDALREDTLTLTSLDSGKKIPSKNPDTYVPSGTFAQAIMLSGADASAAVTSPHNANPMLFRIISNGTLPNHKKSHLKDCLVTAYVSGDISSERGEISLYKLSCTLPNGQVIDPKVEGWIFGRDGKFGVRGRPLWRDGAITQRMFTAGFLSGVASGVSNSYNTNSVSAQGTVQTLNSGKILQNGVASGGAKSMDKLSEYYIQRAEQYHPVIQISPGDVVDVVIRDGFYLDEKKHDHDDDDNKVIPNMFESVETTPVKQTNMISTDSKTLPLSEDQVKRIQENEKQLGLRVTGGTN